MNRPSDLPQQLAGFGIVRLLGEGISSRVYLAEQAQPRRVVALKVLRAVSVSDEFRRRFEREAELLAALEHPGIARIYAAGVASSDAGPLPWISMEFVDGQPLNVYAQTLGLSARDRLALVAEVSRTIHFAHARGVVHRDLKPENILVDAQGRTRILDFGVASLRGRDPSPVTQVGQVLGTVPYMSPEQLSGDDRGVDPRGDVYALGVIAYELLSGRLPHPGLSRSTVLEALAILRTQQVEPLSQVVPSARGDTETVVMKAMAAEAGQRYGSASEFAADLDRLLTGAPIAARAPTFLYVASLLVRRHKAISVAACVALLSLVGGVFAALHSASVEAQARASAESRAAEAEAVTRFLTDTLQGADPFEAKGAAVTVLDAMAVAQRNFDRDGADLAPAVQVRLLNTLSYVKAQLGQLDDAFALTHRASAIARERLAADDLPSLRQRTIEATLLRIQGKGEEARAVAAPVAALPPSDHEREVLRLEANHVLVGSWYDAGDIARAAALLEPLVAEARERLGPDEQTTLELSQSFAALLHQQGRFQEGLPFVKALIERELRRFGPDHPVTLMTRQEAAQLARESGDLAEAESIQRQVLETRRRVLGAENFSTLAGEIALDQILLDAGKIAEAEPRIEGLVPTIRRVLGDDHPDTIQALALVARLAFLQGRWSEAESGWHDVIAKREKRSAKDGPGKLEAYDGLGQTLAALGRCPEAVALFADLQPRARAALPAGHPLIDRIGRHASAACPPAGTEPRT